MTRSRTLLTALVSLLATGSLFAADPRLTIITPRGIQRGAEHELTFSGNRLADAEEILFYSPGFEVVEITSDNANRCKVKVKVAPDARLGEHVATVRCKSGLTDYRTFYVGALPAIDEKEPNTDFEAPQVIDLGVTVHGVVATEDVDYYAVTAKKGQRVVAEIEAMRLGTYLFDPYVAILDAKRFELDAADDSALLWQDAVASIVAPEDGTYVVAVRESAYGGNGNCRYCLHVGSFPRPKAAYPAGGPIGQEVDVTYIGDPTGNIAAKVTTPAAIEDEYAVFATDATGIAPSGNVFRLSNVPNVLETEPNEDRAKLTAATTFPAAFNGVIEKADDNDWFKFTAKKGQTFEVECYARRIRSPLDPLMDIYDAKGARLASNDDSRGPDSYFRWAVPEDGDYFLWVRDHLQNGGPDYVYRVEFQPVEPQLEVSIPRTSRYGQERQQIYVARGNRFATLIAAKRTNFGGQLVLDGKDLPAGVTMHAEPMPDYQSTMPVVFEAAADAPIAGKLVDFTARLDSTEKTIAGGFSNRALMILGSPGQSEYWNRDANRLPIAVVEELPYTLAIVEPKVPIVQDGSMQLKIVATRKEGFTAAINVQFPFRPPGISASSSVNILAGKNEVLYPVSANGNARVGDYKVYALGSADVGNGTGWASSALTTFRISAPYMQLVVERTAVEQGQEIEVFCKVTPSVEFPGDAVAQLVGLPTKATTENATFNKETKEFSFKVKTDPATPEGRHKNLFCYVTVTENGEPIQHRLGSGELRVDKPLPKPVAKPEPAKPAVAATPMPEAPKPPMEKRLTRLEQLRLDAKKRLEEANAGGGS